MQTAPYAVIAMGVTFVLLLGEIDLSIGFVSGVGGVLTAILLTPDGNELATPIVLLIACAAGVAIGTLHGLIITKVGVPSFVVTLAGLLAWNGVVLLLIGSRGTVILQDDFVIGIANDFLPAGTAWILMIACVALYAAIQLASLRSRKAAGLATDPPLIVGLRVGGLAVVLAVVVCGRQRGSRRARTSASWSPGCSCSGPSSSTGRSSAATSTPSAATPRRRGAPASTSTTCASPASRSVVHGRAGRDHPRLAPAVGGHEHGRRPGAAVPDRRGGHRRHVAVRRARHDEGRAARRRGHASIDNGLGLLGLWSGTKFVLTGGVLLLAVTVDSISRRGREASGRA